MFHLLKSLLRYRSLLFTLTGRELKARYRGSVLGYLWSLVNPILLLLVYTFVFGTIFRPRDPNVSPYAFFLACGVFPWLWLSASWVEGTAALAANAGLIRKAAFPAHILPLVSVLTNLVHFAFAMPVIAGAILYFRSQGAMVGGWSGLLAPLVVLLELPLVAGLALAFAALNVHFKDTKDILSNLLTLLFFMTPILYSLNSLKDFAAVHWLVARNPLTPFITAYQETLFYGRLPPLGAWLEMTVISLVVFWCGAWIFDRLADTLVEAV
jgi:ABC-type polysaccharide/polyol phosphate export permease